MPGSDRANTNTHELLTFNIDGKEPRKEGALLSFLVLVRSITQHDSMRGGVLHMLITK
jgi:hypothetical protein